MEQHFTDGIVDFLSEQKVYYTTDRIYRFRGKMKAGVTTLTLGTLASAVTAVDYGTGAGFTTSVTSGATCGTFITLIFTQEVDVTDDLGPFFSQFDRVLDPLPDGVKHQYSDSQVYSDGKNPLIIDSPAFTAPQGLFDGAEIGVPLPVFYYSTTVTHPEKDDTAVPGLQVVASSTFTTAPKIYSDAVMAAISVFPFNSNSVEGIPYDVTSSGAWAPFRYCTKVTSIAPQGSFQRIDHLGPCDFTIYDGDGFGTFSAYPSGGSPISIVRYVNASRARVSASFPSFDTSRLKICVEHFSIRELVIDSIGGPAMPLGGLSFEGLTMDTLIMPHIRWTLSLPRQNNEYLCFSFGWTQLGVVAPKACRDLRGLHVIYQTVTKADDTNRILTGQLCADRILYAWGAALKDFEQAAAGAFTEDYMPLVPEGVVFSVGHYERIFMGHEGMVTEEPQVASFRQKAERQYVVQPLPETVETLYRYAACLYAHQVITTPITVPAAPSSITFQRDSYMKTFYNAVGMPKVLTPATKDKNMLLAWARSGPYDRPDFHIVPHPETGTGDFATYWKSKEQEWPATKHHGNGNSPYSYRTSDAVTTTYADPATFFTDALEDESFTYTVRVIEAPITLEKGDYSALQVSGNWQRDCFFGAGVNPEEVDCLIQIPDCSVGEWGSYDSALCVYFGEPDTDGFTFWDGAFYVEKESSVETDRLVRWVLMTDFGSIQDDVLAQYAYSLDRIVFSVSGKHADDKHLGNFNNCISSEVITGDAEAFLQAHDITLDERSSFTGGTDTYLFTMKESIPMGLNVRYLEALNVPADAMFTTESVLFYISYTNADMKGVLGIESDNLKNEVSDYEQAEAEGLAAYQPYAFAEPFWIQSACLKQVLHADYVIHPYGQETLTQVATMLSAGI